jgi:uracil-DNA glycosylase family 4
MTTKELKQLLLEELYAPYKNCLLCPLSIQGRTHVVFGRGNPDAKILLIGEAPGKEEDLQSQPFVGRSGKLLSKALESLSIKETDVYITNIVKCRPPLNRTPLPNESALCTKLLLEEQIKIISPSVICSLGSCATKFLLKKNKEISKIRGTIQSYRSVNLIPTYHPAYILRNQKSFPLFLSDLALAFDLIIPNKQ